ncbi:MAG: DNA translocase FtsK 4TM domain-containing protein [Candidatus Faecisoma sp.]|nr:DNA translocase FtsK [Acholeplasma sp.]MDY2893038.1 DNA translocase FtsK 4TM domain-containing protein [Candidatus Faecisoma sp.]
MPKKKKRKEVKKDSNAWIEVKGILLILITVIGLCKFKPLSNIINGFAGFLVGVWWGVLLLLVGIIGGYMIVKRSKPDLLTSHFIGLYVIIIGLLALSHVGYIDKNITKSLEEGQSLSYSVVFEETFNNLNNFIDGSLDIQGGGVIGALFGVTLVKLLSITGANVVSIVLMVCGFIMFTGITLYDIAKTLKKGVKKTVELKNKAKIKEEVKKVEDFFEKDNKPVVSTDVQDKEEKDNRVIISSVDELIKDEEIKPDFNDEDIEILDVKDYSFPPITLLKKNTKNNSKENQESVKNTIPVLQEVFKDFGIDAKVVAVNIGPAVTQYEMEVKAGTKLSKVISLDRELALALAAKSVHIQAPIPGKKTIGIETPNKVNTMVSVRELLEAIPKSLSDSKLLVTLGKDILGKPVFCEINKTPHLLVAGATGSGKSVCINSMLVSILMRTKPDEVKLVLVDPKKVELSIYNGVPHLLTPVVTDPRKANIVLKKIVAEMDRRYDLFEQSGTKNIAGYNTYIDKKNKTKDEYGQIKKMPYIVVIIDELADLMLVAAKEVEDSIMRITQMARAAGIHLIVATQRPSTDVITGVVKANIPSRISFSVSSSIDSRTILDMTGAEKLLGKGDMLFLPQGENIPLRVQGTFISDDEIKSVVDYTIAQQKVHYDVSMENNEVGTTTGVEMDATEEPLYNDMVEFVVTQGKASASLLQRRFKIGYNRAARAIDILEERGIVGPSNGSKPREVLFKVENKE